MINTHTYWYHAITYYIRLRHFLFWLILIPYISLFIRTRISSDLYPPKFKYFEDQLRPTAKKNVSCPSHLPWGQGGFSWNSINFIVMRCSYDYCIWIYQRQCDIRYYGANIMLRMERGLSKRANFGYITSFFWTFKT